MRRVTLVCGPPCAGKSTLVAGNRSPTDAIADVDEIAELLGSADRWTHAAVIRDAAERRMAALIDSVGQMDEGCAWVIRCAPDPVERASLAGYIRADRVVVLLPPLGLLLGRAGRRPAARETRRAIMRWMDRYEPWAGDELVRS